MAPGAIDANGFSPHHVAGRAPQYWSQRALQEDKRKCLTELPHTDHSISNTLEYLHEDKKHHSCKAVAEKKKLHQPMVNDIWRRRASTPTHPYASSLADQKKFWSHADLMDTQRKHGALHNRESTARVPLSARERPRDFADGCGMPNSARSPGSIAFSDLSRSQSVDAIGFGRRSSCMLDDVATGARSPTMMEVMQHAGSSRRDHPHNTLASSWWQTCRENRDTATPHRSHEIFTVKKVHHACPIHVKTTDSVAHGGGPAQNSGDTPNRAMLFQRDPKGHAVQGDYPHCQTNEAWAAPRGDETPPSRYHSLELMNLDKRRHATPIDGGKRWQKNARAVKCSPRGEESFHIRMPCG